MGSDEADDEIARIPCRLGGERPYFVCMCGRRAIKLYAGGRYFRCRRCCDLAHASQNEDGWGRARRRALKRNGASAATATLTARFPSSSLNICSNTRFFRASTGRPTQRRGCRGCFLRQSHPDIQRVVDVRPIVEFRRCILRRGRREPTKEESMLASLQTNFR